VSTSGDFSRHPPTEEDRAEIVELLIERGAKVDQDTRAGITVVYAAAIKRGARVMKALLRAGAKPDAPTGTQHMTPLLLAAQVGKAETVQVLLDAGADPTALTRQGETVLHVAAASGNTEVVRWLLDNHFAVNEKNKNLGGTPLHYAALANSLECVELLLAAGAQPNALDKGNAPPLALAINEKIRMEYLASDGIPQAERLRLLAKNMLDRLLIIHRLLAAGARTKLKSGPDEAGNLRELDLVQYAKENGAPEIVELLQNPPAATRKPR
jgi:ankyrin repeat protein